jgi:RNA polymerase sigma-70 factor (ECF subfamily)
VLTEPGRFAMTGIAANGQPALAAYLRGDDGLHRAHAIQVLTFSDAGIGRIVSFNDAGLFPMFGLPGVAPPGAGSVIPGGRAAAGPGASPAAR